jgi:4-oxalocrotonate tautomerase
VPLLEQKPESRALTSVYPKHSIFLEKDVPYVNIKIIDEGVTNEQKQGFIKGTTKFMLEVLDKDSATTLIVINEVTTDNLGIGFD